MFSVLSRVLRQFKIIFLLRRMIAQCLFYFAAGLTIIGGRRPSLNGYEDYQRLRCEDFHRQY